MTYWHLIEALKSGCCTTLQTSDGPIYGAIVIGVEAVGAADGTRSAWNVTYHRDRQSKRHEALVKTVD